MGYEWKGSNTWEGGRIAGGESGEEAWVGLLSCSEIPLPPSASSPVLMRPAEMVLT